MSDDKKYGDGGPRKDDPAGPHRDSHSQNERQKSAVTDDMRGLDDGPLEFGCVLDGKGGARRIEWPEARDWKPAKKGEVLWMHMRRDDPEVRDWINHDEAIPPRTTMLMLSDHPAPTAFSDGDTLLAVLRGVGDLRPDRSSSRILVQLWSDGERVISLRENAVMTPQDVMQQFHEQKGPRDAGALFARLVRKTIAGMGRAIIQMDDEIDCMESSDLGAGNPNKLLSRIGQIRRDCLSLERHMGPQHDALQRIVERAPDWFGEDDRAMILDTIERLRLYLGDIDVSKESAVVLMDEIRAHSAARTRFTSLVISVLSTIFLPLTFLTGLLGINVGGIPGAKNPDAFWIVVLICAGTFAVLIALISRMAFFRNQE